MKKIKENNTYTYSDRDMHKDTTYSFIEKAKELDKVIVNFFVLYLVSMVALIFTQSLFVSELIATYSLSSFAVLTPILLSTFAIMVMIIKFNYLDINYLTTTLDYCETDKDKRDTHYFKFSIYEKIYKFVDKSMYTIIGLCLAILIFTVYAYLKITFGV